MGFQVNCDRCGRFMRTVKASEIKSVIKTDPVCDVCLKVEETVLAKVEKYRRQAEVELKRVHVACKALLIETIQEEVAKNYGNPG